MSHHLPAEVQEIVASCLPWIAYGELAYVTRSWNACVREVVKSLRNAPVMIRIGRPKQGFVYTKVCDGLYRCCRCSDVGLQKGLMGTSVLCLFRADGYWWAFDAPSDAELATVKACGVPVFRSRASILQPGWHPWEINVDAHKARGQPKWGCFPQLFQTTLVDA